MIKYNFPSEFIFGTAVASYQVEGGIYNNDWTHWENKPKTVCNEPCNEACKHFELVDNDIALLKDLGLKPLDFQSNGVELSPKEENMIKSVSITI